MFVASEQRGLSHYYSEESRTHKQYNIYLILTRPNATHIYINNPSSKHPLLAIRSRVVVGAGIVVRVSHVFCGGQSTNEH